jgi:hypothetical protein
MARKPKEYIHEQAKIVRSLSAYGVPEEDIASEIDMCVETMHKLYGKELRAGRIKADSKIRQTLYDKAVNQGNTACLLFMCKTRLGMRETNRLEMTSPDGSLSPLDVQVNFIGVDNAED